MKKQFESEPYEHERTICRLRPVLKSHFLNCALLRAGGILTAVAFLGLGAATPIAKALSLEPQVTRLLLLIALTVFVHGVTLIAVGIIHGGSGKTRAPAYFFQYREILTAIDIVDAIYVDRAKNDGVVVDPELVAFGDLKRLSMRDTDLLVELRRKLRVASNKAHYLDDLESAYLWLKDARVEPTKSELKALQKAISVKK
ncbi:hypothetical protein OTK49_03225 [Vibrio coralliirubri]|uniref:hypothetical protein n=1 Tax=Vibrio coralliirubri TaxID=1516159 RepID=UPI0022843F13|nr:hypothetical protein [Vibrio coralliirubri]MCY9861528.1 hypothetical protein [Vibrio coralliirubri]